MLLFDPTSADVAGLRAQIDGDVVAPGDLNWDDARRAFNLAVDQRPDLVAIPHSIADVRAIVEYARANGLRIAPQATGHNARPLGSLSGAILLKTSAMRGVEIDPYRQTARVEAGVEWREVAERISELGLMALSGSSPDVGVVGYSLGGGVGWAARKHGLAANSVIAIDIVTADGRLVRADREHEPDLFWALRGAGGNFGVVVAMEFELYPAPELHGGWMIWPWERAGDVLRAWRKWSATAPEEVTTAIRILQLPPLPDIPEPIRGRQIIAIDGVYLGPKEAADAVLAPLRALEPEIDTFADMPPAGLVRLHGASEHPVPGVSSSALLVDGGDEMVEAIEAVAGAGSGSPLMMVELRQLGGALARSDDGHGALDRVEGDFALLALGVPMGPEITAEIEARLARLSVAVAPYDNGRRYMGFTERKTDTGSGYSAATYDRLRAVKAAYDPADVFKANHAITPAT